MIILTGFNYNYLALITSISGKFKNVSPVYMTRAIPKVMIFIQN